MRSPILQRRARYYSYGPPEHGRTRVPFIFPPFSCAVLIASGMSFGVRDGRNVWDVLRRHCYENALHFPPNNGVRRVLDISQCV